MNAIVMSVDELRRSESVERRELKYAIKLMGRFVAGTDNASDREHLSRIFGKQHSRIVPKTPKQIRMFDYVATAFLNGGDGDE